MRSENLVEREMTVEFIMARVCSTDESRCIDQQVGQRLLDFPVCISISGCSTTFPSTHTCPIFQSISIETAGRVFGIQSLLRSAVGKSNRMSVYDQISQRAELQPSYCHSLRLLLAINTSDKYLNEVSVPSAQG